MGVGIVCGEGDPAVRSRNRAGLSGDFEGFGKFQLHDRNIRIRSGSLEFDGNTFRSDMGSDGETANQYLAGGWKLVKAGHGDFTVGRPIPDLRIHGHATIGSGLLRHATPGKAAGKGATFGGIDGFAILLHPAAHGLESFDAGLGNAALGVGPHVEEEVATLARDVREIAKDLADADPVIVVLFVTPSVIHGHADFEDLSRIPSGWDSAFGGFGVAKEAVLKAKAVVTDDFWRKGQ